MKREESRNLSTQFSKQDASPLLNLDPIDPVIQLYRGTWRFGDGSSQSAKDFSRGSRVPTSIGQIMDRRLHLSFGLFLLYESSEFSLCGHGCN